MYISCCQLLTKKLQTLENLIYIYIYKKKMFWTYFQDKTRALQSLEKKTCVLPIPIIPSSYVVTVHGLVAQLWAHYQRQTWHI